MRPAGSFRGSASFEVESAGPVSTAEIDALIAGMDDGHQTIEITVAGTRNHPTIVCLVGSTRFSDAYRDVNLRETLAGRIVLSIGCDTKSDEGLGITNEQKAMLDELHLRKIDFADEVLVINVGRYMGESTRRELAYALDNDKRVRWLETPWAIGDEY